MAVLIAVAVESALCNHASDLLGISSQQPNTDCQKTPNEGNIYMELRKKVVPRSLTLRWLQPHASDLAVRWEWASNTP